MRNNNYKNDKMEEAIMFLSRCIDSLEFPYVMSSHRKKEFETREERVKKILK